MFPLMLYSITNIDICARFSTRYETNHILQWIDHYKMVGVSNIHLYMDVDSSNMSDFAQKNVYDKLMNIERVTVYNTTELGIVHQGIALNHCTKMVDQSGSMWGLDIDIDEMIAFGPTIQKYEDCAFAETTKNSFSSFLDTISSNVSGILLPRLSFGTNNVTVASPSDSQQHLYTRRAFSKLSVGKFIFRSNLTGAKVRSKHEICTLPNVLIINSDLSVSTGTSIQIGRTEYKHHDILQSWTNTDTISSSPRLFHYITRSEKECLLKIRDVTAPWHTKQGMSDWRKVNNDKGHGCSHSKHNSISDYTLACVK